MAIQGVIYQNQKVSAEDHAALFQMFISDGILAGCGMSKLRNVLTIDSGMFVLAGRLSKIIGSEQITIPDTIRSTTARLTGVIDLTQSATKTEFHQFSFRLDAASGGAYPVLRKENINTGNGQYYEVEWAILTIDEDGNITNVEKKIGNSEGTTPGGGGAEGDFHFDTENGMLYVKEGSDWEVAFLLSGTLILDKQLNNVDVFMINAGMNGTNGSDGDSGGGTGGNGGKYQTWAGTSIPAGTYAIAIGQSNGAVTSFGELMEVAADSPSVNGGQGAVGGIYSGGNHAADPGADGVYAFEDNSNLIYPARKYGSSGGGGGTSSSNNGASFPGQSGGENAGAGSSNVNTNGGPGLANTGSGGGGGFGRFYNGSGSHSNGGNGGSGIILIRPARAAS